MTTFFCRKYTGTDAKFQLEKSPVLLKDLTATVTTFSLDIGGFDVQEQELGTSDTYALVNEVDLSTIYIKNHTPASVGYLIVTGTLSGGDSGTD